MVVTRPISSLVTKTKPSAGPRTNRTQSSGEFPLLEDFSLLHFSLCHHLSAGFMLQEGPLMGIVFAAFLVGVSLMGGLWCIYTYTGTSIVSLVKFFPVTDQKNLPIRRFFSVLAFCGISFHFIFQIMKSLDLS